MNREWLPVWTVNTCKSLSCEQFLYLGCDSFLSAKHAPFFNQDCGTIFVLQEKSYKFKILWISTKWMIVSLSQFLATSAQQQQEMFVYI